MNLTDFLLMVIAASLTKKSPDQVYAAYEAQMSKSERTASKYSPEDIDEIYKAYPSRDPANNNRSLGKSISNKARIRRLLATYTKEDLLEAIEAEKTENEKSGKWLKNFGTFLNNIPDLREEEPQEKSIYQK